MPLPPFSSTTPVATPTTSGKAKELVFNIMDYGAKVDGATNDTTAIQNALNAAGSAVGTGPSGPTTSVVYIPAGITTVTSLVIPNFVTLKGAGMHSTKIFQISGTNANCITNYVSPDGVIANAEWIGIRDLMVDGHRSGTGGGSGNSSGDGIHLNTNPTNTAATNDVTFDTHQLIENVAVYHCAGWGFYQTGRGETRYNNLYCESNASGGIYTTYDAYLFGCSAGDNGGPGFEFSHGDIMAVCCKAFDNGQLYNQTFTNQPGFLITGGTAAGITLVGCIAQNNNAQGFFLNGVSCITLQGCVADSNNMGIAPPTTANTQGQYAGVELYDSFYCIVDVVTTQGYQAGNLLGNQGWGLRVNNSSNFNDLRVTQYNQSGYTGLGPVSSDSIYLGNSIYANGTCLTPNLNTAVVLALSANSATPAINTSNYNVVHITGQTAAITSFSSGLTGSPVDGQTLRISITGTAAVALTWGSSFESSTIALPSTTVSTNRLDVAFFWNSETSKWRCEGVA